MEVAFFLCAAILRELRTPRETFTFLESMRSKDTADIGLVKFLIMILGPEELLELTTMLARIALLQ